MPAPKKLKSPNLSEQTKILIEKSLDDDQAIDIFVIDLTNKTNFADYMIIATGKSTRHVKSMAEHIEQKLKGINPYKVQLEGMDKSEWVLLDAGDVIVHLFKKEMRDYYRLEKMWSDDSEPSSADNEIEKIGSK